MADLLLKGSSLCIHLHTNSVNVGSSMHVPAHYSVY